MVFIKQVPKGGIGVEADNKRKREELDQTKGDMGKGSQKDNYWPKTSGYAGHGSKGSGSAWQDRGGWKTPQKKQPWFAVADCDHELENDMRLYWSS
eukprot:6104714-Heterocapsa_arctica.AAC.1